MSELVEKLAVPEPFICTAVPEPPSTAKVTVPVGMAVPEFWMTAAENTADVPWPAVDGPAMLTMVAKRAGATVTDWGVEAESPLF